MRRLLAIVGFLALVSLITTVIIFYARGYRPNLTEKTLTPTGIVSIKSEPRGALVFVNNEEKGSTDLDITDLSPGRYKVKIVKEGFSTWEKEITVRKEVVNQLKVILFPLAPSLKALTFTGIVRPTASPSGDKIVFGLLPPHEKAGVWALNLSTSPLPSFFTKELIQLVADTKDFAFSSGEFEFSPDGKQLLVKLASQSIFFLLDASSENKNLKEVTLDIEKLAASWQEKKSTEKASSLKALGKQAETAAEDLSGLVFSPDKQRFFGRQKDGSWLLFNGRPEPNGDKAAEIFNLPATEGCFWYPDSQHLILVNKGVISIADLDGSNNIPIYTGSFEPGFLAVWPDGSKLLIATSFNTNASNYPNLYAIELH